MNLKLEVEGLRNENRELREKLTTRPDQVIPSPVSPFNLNNWRPDTQRNRFGTGSGIDDRGRSPVRTGYKRPRMSTSEPSSNRECGKGPDGSNSSFGSDAATSSNLQSSLTSKPVCVPTRLAELTHVLRSEQNPADRSAALARRSSSNRPAFRIAVERAARLGHCSPRSTWQRQSLSNP